MAASAVLTPFTVAPGQRSGRLWWKRVLPVGEIDYKGRQLHFTREYNDALAAAFAQRAYDQVPFQLADGANAHTNDPERFRGDVVDMQSRDDGLYIALAPTPAGDEVLEANPYLGVSARIVEDYARSDGKFYPAAVQHVLGTLDPRIPGLGAWQAVEMANPPDQVLDLTGYQFTDDGGGGMPDIPDLNDPETAAKLAALLRLDPAEIQALAVSLGGGPVPAGGLDADEISDEELAELIASMPEDQLRLLEADYARELEAQPAGAAAGLSAEGLMALEMAQATADENARELAVIRGQLDAEQFEAEKRRLVADVGVPPYIVDLARPLLEGTGHTVDLANGTSTDGGQVMRSVLTEFGRAARMLDLGIELGSQFDEPEGHQQAAAARDDVVARFRGQTGI